MIAEEWGISNVEILYAGAVTHQQNRAMINVLDIDPVHIDDHSLEQFDLIAFVDHSIAGRNNSVPEDFIPDIVIDHHPTDGIRAKYIDQRAGVGATATLLTRYLQAYDIELTERLATALLFGVHRETLNFTRGTTPAEHAAACFLHPAVDHSTIETLSNSVFTPETLGGIGDAIINREVRGSCLVSSLGRVSERDILPQAADYLLKLEGISTTIVFGIVESEIHLSARTSNANLHIGNLMRETFDEVGSAGGHHDMAGGQVPLGLLGATNDSEDVAVDLINKSVTTRLFEALSSWTDI
ncbi:hypothetical protein C488_14812 [Natrinema pellirubrum DSM 15624]|nr:hypothetical protein C488_14812 [Natrinema pellirubrum DSM 15624]